MRRLGLFILCLGMAFVLSCSEDETNTPPVYTEITPYGTFEGEWQLSKYDETCPGTITVYPDSIVFDMPAEYLIPRLGLVNETSKADHPKVPFFWTKSDYTYSRTTQKMFYSVLGYSTESIYIKNEVMRNMVDMLSKTNSTWFFAYADGVEYQIWLDGLKEQPSGVFNNVTGQWMLAIPIDMVTIFNGDIWVKTNVNISIALLDEDAPDKSAWLLVFKGFRKNI